MEEEGVMSVLPRKRLPNLGEKTPRTFLGGIKNMPELPGTFRY